MPSSCNMDVACDVLRVVGVLAIVVRRGACGSRVPRRGCARSVGILACRARCWGVSAPRRRARVAAGWRRRSATRRVRQRKICSPRGVCSFWPKGWESVLPPLICGCIVCAAAALCRPAVDFIVCCAWRVAAPWRRSFLRCAFFASDLCWAREQRRLPCV